MADNFTIFPAIDLRGGRVVRLAQGDPDRQTVYGQDPLAWAERWIAEGADWLHVINLDGAFGEDARKNTRALQTILSTGIKVEYGGGLRSRATIQAAIDLGVQRVLLGSAAILDPNLVDWAIAAFEPLRISGDIGMRKGKVVIQGWQVRTDLDILEVGKRFRAQGLELCVLTDVQRDGIRSGVDIESASVLQKVSDLLVVASGGIKNYQEVQHARTAGLAGIIIGRALYEGTISLSSCISICNNDIAPIESSVQRVKA